MLDVVLKPWPVLTKMSPMEGLALLRELNVSKSRYSSLIRASKRCGAQIYPSQRQILKAKRFVWPDDIRYCMTNSVPFVNSKIMA